MTVAEACYIPKYATASFKGFEFECLTADASVGRRGARGEFPFGEKTAYTDLGRRIRSYKLKARFSSNNHIAETRSFLAVCESPQPGTLVHPTQGVLRVGCVHASAHDDIIESGGVTTVDIDFVEAMDFLPVGGLLGGILGGVLGGVGNIIGLPIVPFISAIGSAVQTGLNLAAIPFQLYHEVVGTFAELSAVMRDAVQSVAGINPELSIWTVRSDLDRLAADATPMADPAVTWTVINNGFQAIDYYAATPAARIEAVRAVVNWASTARVLSGDAGKAQDLVIGAVRAVGAAYIARAAMETIAKNRQEALDQHDAVMTVLTEESRAAYNKCDNRVYFAIRDLIASVQPQLLNRAYHLPPLVTYTFPGSISALDAAFEIYGDAKRHRDLEKWNSRAPPWALGPGIIAYRSAGS